MCDHKDEAVAKYLFMDLLIVFIGLPVIKLPREKRSKSE